MGTIHIQTLGWVTGKEIREAESRAQMKAYELKMEDWRKRGWTQPVHRGVQELDHGRNIWVTTEVD